MEHRTRLGVTAAITTAFVIGGTAPASAATITIRPGDLVQALSQTGAGGDVAFRADGLRVTSGSDADPARNVAGEYWARTGGLPNTMSLSWIGSANAPAVSLVFDTDSNRANGGSINVLVADSDPTTDFWYVGGQAQADARGIGCPSDTPDSGSDCHGTLDQWRGVLADEELWAVGFYMTGSGNGVLESVDVDGDTYEFTNQSAPGPDPVVTPVTGHADAFKARKKRKAVVRMWTEPMAAGQAEGRKARFSITVDRKRVFRAVKGEDTSARWSRKFRKRTGKHVVRVYVNGVLEDRVRIRTGKPRRR